MMSVSIAHGSAEVAPDIDTEALHSNVSVDVIMITRIIGIFWRSTGHRAVSSADTSPTFTDAALYNSIHTSTAVL